MKIVIAGNYGAKNIGDEMILEGLIKAMKTIEPKAQIAVLSANPEETSSKYDVKSGHKFPAGIRSLFKFVFNFKNKTRKMVRECDYFVLGGGGLFAELTLKSYFIWGLQAFMAYHYEKPVIMYGQSIGPFRGGIQKYIVKKIFKKAIFIAVRDKDSKDELKNLKINSKIHLLPDMVFRLKSPSKNIEREKKIIVALRYMENFDEKLKNQIVNFLNFLITKEDYHVEFANFQIPDDERVTNEIIRKINNQEKISIMPHPQNAEILLKHFASANFVLGMRLHSIISAIKSQTPFIAINYAAKVEGLLKYAKLGETILNEEENLKNKFLEINNAREEFIKKLEVFNLLAEKRHHEVEEDLKSLLS